MTLLDYISQNKTRYEDELKAFLRIPSISTEPDNTPDVRRCAEFVRDELTRIGLNDVAMYETARHPIVFGQWLDAGPNAHTVLFYGHYDVQPVDPLDLWTNPPFEPTIHGDQIYARGASDDKGQVYLQLKALEALLKTDGKLPVNVKVIIEGEEEIGSPNLEPFLEQHADMLACDTVLVSDTPMYDYGMPSLCYGLRGLCYMEVEVVGPDRDLHSGSYGGVVENPINALARMISKLKDENGHILIAGFYDSVVAVGEEERQELARLPFDEEARKKDLTVDTFTGEREYLPRSNAPGHVRRSMSMVFGVALQARVRRRCCHRRRARRFPCASCPIRSRLRSPDFSKRIFVRSRRWE
jgi:acetylornithine deacetylase/succinyl-diaminopimelate desuccinylase-like protein